MIKDLVRSALAAVVPALLLAAGGPAAAQARAPAGAGIGYVINAPHQFLGFSGHALSSRYGGLGLYVDVKLDMDSPGDAVNFTPGLTAREAELGGDHFFQDESSWRNVNVAIIRPVSRETWLYAGAGYAEKTLYEEWQGRQQGGVAGAHYWVENQELSGSMVNLLGGAFFRVGRVSFQFGGETSPVGATVGAIYTIPL